ncbi:hypothetical protein [Nonlabens sp. SY33080]|uniref:hypothetical protein n=1 Tax=unclassified Nonlabens TaxID=2615035 RepID=UPI001428BBA9|nr:hypothetical protein [Nonlabens sp. SY33080]
MKTIRILKRSLSITGLVLTLPIIGMVFSKEVNWGLLDFLVMGVMLFTTSVLLHYIWFSHTSSKWRYGLIVLALIAFFLLWIELAVGIFN